MAQTFRIQFFGQPRQGVLAAHAFQAHERGDGEIIHEPAHVAEAAALDQRAQQKTVQHLAHRRGVGTGAHHRAMRGEPFDEAKVFEEAAPSGESAVGRQRRVGASDGEFAPERVQGNLVLPFTGQVKGNQRCRRVHHPNPIGLNRLCLLLQLRRIGLFKVVGIISPASLLPSSRTAAANGATAKLPYYGRVEEDLDRQSGLARDRQCPPPFWLR